MHNLKIYALLMAGMLMAACQRKAAPGAGAGWKLVWSDEFNGAGLPDTTKWDYNTGGNGFGNNELQYYTRARTQNARVENGRLIITARKEDWENRHYTSAKLVTKGIAEWQYGKITVRAKLPTGRGMWPAIWMLASTPDMKWPDDGEIDIMEQVGFDPRRIHGSVHTKKYNHVIGTQKTAIDTVPDATTAFHDYSIVWTAEKIETYIDDKKYFSFDNEHGGPAAWPFDHPFYLILNVAVGGNWGGQKGIDDAIFPQQMEIEYVKVYKAR